MEMLHLTSLQLRVSLLCLLIGSSSACLSRNKVPLLSPQEGSEKSEAKISSFLQNDGRWQVQIVPTQGQEKVLVVKPKGSPAAPGVFLIDTAPSSADGSELAMQLRVDSLQRVAPSQRAAALARINAHHVDNWAGTFMIDGQGALIGQWTLNLPGAPLQAIFVKDALERLAQSWIELHSDLQSHKLELQPALP